MVKLFRNLALSALFMLTMIASASAYSGSVASLNPRLRSLLYRVEAHFHRPVVVVSGCRSFAHNRRIGGARESWHLRCLAADITVANVKKYIVARFASTLAGRGGIGTYCHDSSIHIDVGPRREWYWCDRVRTFSQGDIRRTVAYHGRRHFRSHRWHHKHRRHRR